jgi:Tfp pilus assembly protein PilN
MPKVSGDPWILSAVILAIVAIAAFGWMHFAVAGEAEDLEVQIAAAEADSARFADVIERAERLQSQRDSIASRVAVIQEIDGARYVWPHVMDEVARAIPEYTWMTRMVRVSPPPELAFRVQGRSATLFALTIFLENLEASPFMRNARLVTADQVVVSMGGGTERLVYNFTVEVNYQDPPPEILNREPLFGPSVAIPGLDEEG